MNREIIVPVLFAGIFTAVAGSFIYKAFKYGGFKAALFGAPIERTVGEVAGGRPALLSSSIRVHVLGGNLTDRAVGLELSSKSPASYHMFPVTLSVPDVSRLIELLQESIRNR